MDAMPKISEGSAPNLYRERPRADVGSDVNAVAGAGHQAPMKRDLREGGWVPCRLANQAGRDAGATERANTLEQGSPTCRSDQRAGSQPP